MTRDLYFVPLIVRALQHAERSDALLRTFAEIEKLGREPGYGPGYANFLHFMAEVQRHADSGALPPTTFDGNEDERKAALDLLLSQPRLQAEYERWSARADVQRGDAETVTFVLWKGAELVARMGLRGECPHESVGHVLPGDYSLVLETGRVIWADNLTASDLLWSAAFPGRALELAADTGQFPPTATRETKLLDGELILRVFPGLESGRIELELRQSTGP